jgi:hypothetical protein
VVPPGEGVARKLLGGEGRNVRMACSQVLQVAFIVRRADDVPERGRGAREARTQVTGTMPRRHLSTSRAGRTGVQRTGVTERR